jgi:hypothetical protein
MRDRPVDHLSGGQRKCAWIALMLAQGIVRAPAGSRSCSYAHVRRSQCLLSSDARLRGADRRCLVAVLQLPLGTASSERLRRAGTRSTSGTIDPPRAASSTVGASSTRHGILLR